MLVLDSDQRVCFFPHRLTTNLVDDLGPLAPGFFSCVDHDLLRDFGLVKLLGYIHTLVRRIGDHRRYDGIWQLFHSV
jgi:hypothetical protein